MAEAANAPFVWGAGGSKDSMTRRRQLAEALIKSGIDYSPVGHWTQGLARLSQALLGGYESGQLDKQEKASNEGLARTLEAALGASATPAASADVAPSAPSMTGGGSRTMAMPNVTPEVKDGIVQTASALGISPVDLATAISYETGGTFDPTKAGPTTKWGQHRGLIQFGEPQAKQFGVDWSNPVGSQLGANGAVANYLRNAGVKPGMGLMDVYSAINAGGVGLYNRSDAAAGGAPGTVADKVNQQMAGHRAKAQALFADLPAPGASPVSMETGQPGFAVPRPVESIPGDDPQKLRAEAQAYAQTNPEAARQMLARAEAAEAAAQPQIAPAAAPPSAMTGATFNAITGGQPLDPVFQTEGVSQPWLGTALEAAQPQMVGAPMPPPRPADLALAQADIPASGAVEAVGQIPPPIPPDLSNTPDAGSRTFAATAGGTMPVGAGVGGNPLSGLVQALTGGGQSASAATPPAAVQQVASAVVSSPQAASSPLGQLAIALMRSGRVNEGVKLATSLLQPERGVTMGDRLIDPRTGRVIADYTGANGGRSTEYGLNPVYGVDKDGKTVIMQVGKRGDAVVTKMPEDVSLASGVERVDAGTHFVLMDKRTGQPVGTIPKDIAGTERAKVEGKSQGEASTSLSNTVASAEQALKTIEQVRNHPGRNQFGATGAGTALPVIGDGLPGSKGRDFVGLVNQLKGKAFLEAFESLKGGGQITEVEGNKATEAIARLDRAQTKEGFDQALKDLEDVIRAGISRARQKAGQSGAPSDGAPAPRGGQTRSGVKWSVE